MGRSVKIGYNFSKPNTNITLPSSLQEISGTVILDSTAIACIQDENGILYIYDMLRYRIRKEISFGINGDYEGITKVNHTLYVLRSDGVLFEIEDYTANKLKVKEYKTGIPAVNNEGICYDESNNRLLIGEKGKINKDPLNKNYRCIYAFDLKSKALDQTPVFNFNTIDINISAKMQGIMLPKKKNKKGDLEDVTLKLNTSEIGIHPISKQLYILSATDHCLFIFNLNGTLEHIEQLNQAMFNKPESLSFYPNGDLLITNEGQAHLPTLLKFNYTQK
jgi:hypothetical protein